MDFFTKPRIGPVCVVGLGAHTAVGLNAPATAAAVRAGIAGFNEHPFMIDRVGEPMIVALVPDVPVALDGSDRLGELGTPAAKEAFAPLADSPYGRGSEVAAIIGLAAKRPGLADGAVEKITQRMRGIGNGSTISRVEAVPSGHSAGLMALEAGCQEIQGGRGDFCLIGGVDSYLEPETLEWLDEGEQLHSTANSWGFIPGEAAGFCLLASQRAAERCRLKVLGWVLAVATAMEQNLIKTDTVCTGQGLSRAVKQVLQAVPSPEERVNQTICDMNGERYRADEFAFTIARTSERFVDASDFLSPADCWGDVGAASGPLFLNLVSAAARKGYAKGPRTLLWTSSESGERSAAVIYAEVFERK